MSSLLACTISDHSSARRSGFAFAARAERKFTIVLRLARGIMRDTEELASGKKGVTADEGDFLKIAEEYFTSCFQTLTPWGERVLGKAVPNGERQEKPNPAVDSPTKDMFRKPGLVWGRWRRD